MINPFLQLFNDHQILRLARSVVEWIWSTRNDPSRYYVQLLALALLPSRIARNCGEVSKKSGIEMSSYSCFICSMADVSAAGEMHLC